MQLPTLRPAARSRVIETRFGGLNAGESCGAGEFSREENLCDAAWPSVCSRAPRRKLAALQRPHGVYSKGGLLWVDGETLYYNALAVGRVADSDKTFCGIGSRVLIFPDKLMFDTETLTLAPLGAKWAATGQVRFSPCRIDGTAATVRFTGAALPESPENGDYWLDTGGDTTVLRVYAAATDSWSAEDTPYTRIDAAGIGAPFALYDTVTITGASAAVLGESAAALNGDLVIWGKGEDYLIVTALLQRQATQAPADGVLTVERRIPDLDYLTECDNRVWGVAKNGHEIHACKLGDPTNWYNFMGTAADSYAVTVGSDGPFTGVASCMGYVLLFKEGLLHKVYGSKPANYQVVTTACPGVRAGCAGSLAEVGGSLYYLSARGVMAWDGGMPGRVGEKLGAVPLLNGVAGALRGRYALAAQNAEGDWSLYCYSPERQLWHRESLPAPHSVAGWDGGLALLARDGTLWLLEGEGDAGEAEPPAAWFAETGDLGVDTPDRKLLCKAELRLSLAAGASARLAVQYDSDGVWHTVGTLAPGKKRRAALPLIPRRHDHLRLRLSGTGAATLHSLACTYGKGSDL